MRKRTVFLVLAVVFGLGGLAGLRAPGAQAAPCFYRCICGTPYKCCGTACKVDRSGPIQCPQIAC